MLYLVNRYDANDRARQSAETRRLRTRPQIRESGKPVYSMDELRGVKFPHDRDREQVRIGVIGLIALTVCAALFWALW
jgi:hypothetical protein